MNLGYYRTHYDGSGSWAGYIPKCEARLGYHLILGPLFLQHSHPGPYHPIYKSKHGVCLSVVTKQTGQGQGRAGQGRAGRGGQGRHPPTAGHFQLRLERQQWWCLSVWAVPGRFFQSLLVPCGASLDVIPQM
jgi:hypothetical protein